MDLITWYLAQLDEDEAAARSAYYEGQRWLSEEEDVLRWPDDELVHIAARKRDAAHIVRHDPAHVLADIAARRAIVALHTGMHECSSFGDAFRCVHEFEVCDTVRHLASVYAHRPGYDPAWALS